MRAGYNLHMQRFSTLFLQKTDWPLLLGLLALGAFGCVILFSAASGDWAPVIKQLIRFGMGLGVFWALASVPTRRLYDAAPWLYGAGLIALVLVLFISDPRKGAQRWLNFGLFQMQPSELMKIAVPLFMARLCHQTTLPIQTLPMLGGLLMLAIPGFLIMKQPDLGSAIMVMASGGLVLFFAGLSWRWILGAAFALAASLPILYQSLHQYQRERILTFLNPEADPLGQGYHIIQSKIALGSGGLWGKGYLAGTQSQLHFLPERQTDFIFAVLGEELGLMGIGVLALLYAWIIVRGMQLAQSAPDTFSRLVAAGISGTFLFYVLVNIGMVSGVFPVVGVPLPFVSYGGSALVTLFAGFGILNNVSKNHRFWPG